MQKDRDATFKQMVNEALRGGRGRMNRPAGPGKLFRTRPENLREMLFPNLDNVWDVLAEAEGDDLPISDSGGRESTLGF